MNADNLYENQHPIKQRYTAASTSLIWLSQLSIPTKSTQCRHIHHKPWAATPTSWSFQVDCTVYCLHSSCKTAKSWSKQVAGEKKVDHVNNPRDRYSSVSGLPNLGLKTIFTYIHKVARKTLLECSCSSVFAGCGSGKSLANVSLKYDKQKARSLSAPSGQKSLNAALKWFTQGTVKQHRMEQQLQHQGAGFAVSLGF